MGKARLIRVLMFAVLSLCLVWADAASARQRMSFTPGARARHHGYSHRGHRARHHGTSRSSRRHTSAPRRAPRASAKEEGSATTAGKAGGGFTMQDGVLTYPAPARFQPKNLKRP